MGRAGAQSSLPRRSADGQAAPCHWSGREGRGRGAQIKDPTRTPSHPRGGCNERQMVKGPTEWDKARALGAQLVGMRRAQLLVGNELAAPPGATRGVPTGPSVHDQADTRERSTHVHRKTEHMCAQENGAHTCTGNTWAGGHSSAVGKSRQGQRTQTALRPMGKPDAVCPDNGR